MKTITCEQCGTVYNVSKLPIGKKVKCAKCAFVFTIPEEGSQDVTTLISFENNPAVKEFIGEVKFKEQQSPQPQQPAPSLETAEPKKKTARPSHTGAKRGGSKQDRRSKSRVSASLLERTERKQGANKWLLIAGCAGGALLLLLVIIFVFSGDSSDKQPSDTGAGSAEETVKSESYEDKLLAIQYESNIKSLLKSESDPEAEREKLYPQEAQKLFDLSRWCFNNNHIAEYEKHLTEAALLDRYDKNIRYAVKLLYNSKSERTKQDDYKAMTDFGEWCCKVGLGIEGKDALKQAYSAAPEAQKEKIAAILDSFDYVNIGSVTSPEWVTKALAAEFVEINIDPRTKQLKSKLYEFETLFGKDFSYYDFVPFLICIENDPKFNEALIAEDFKKRLFELVELFKKEYGHMIRSEVWSEAVLPVWVFANTNNYYNYGQKVGMDITAGVKGHFEPDRGWLMFPNDSDIPYDVIFHEGTHQILNFATEANRASVSGMFWFDEGIATYFEAFKRMPDGSIKIGVYNESRSEFIKVSVKRGELIPFMDIFAKSYLSFATDMAGRRSAQAQNRYASMFYAQSWSMVYFFHYYDNGKYKSKFNKYMEAELNGKGSFETFLGIFEFSTTSKIKQADQLNQLQKEWLSFVEKLPDTGKSSR